MISRSRLTLLAIIAFLALPFVAATGLYFSGWRPAGTVNHGQLISPPVELGKEDVWQGRWSVLLIHDGPCGPACGERLDQLRRLRLSLGQQTGRTRLVWAGEAITAEAAGLQRSIPDLVALDRSLTGLGRQSPGSVILVDPNGLAMMRYPPGAELKGLRADLERLLKYAWSA